MSDPLAALDSPQPAPSVRPLDLDDIRKRVMQDVPITIEEEILLVGSIRRGYAQQFAAMQAKAPRATKTAGEGRRVAAPASGAKGKMSTTEQFAKLGGLDALDI